MPCYRHIALALFAAFSLLAAPAQATGTRPAATKASRPAPVAAAKAAAPEAAPPQVWLTGTIVGADGVPCAGVCVFPTSNPRLLAVADATGAFRLQVPATTHYLQAEYMGQGSSRVAVDSQHPQSLTIVLGH